jgi:hypothetical protein
MQLYPRPLRALQALRRGESLPLLEIGWQAWVKGAKNAH